MGAKLDIELINEEFKFKNKPITLIGEFSNVHDFALFECDNGHTFKDIARNVVNRKSTDITKYCSQCKDEGMGVKRKLMATWFPSLNLYEVWHQMGSKFVVMHTSYSREELLKWCMKYKKEVPTWTNDDDRFNHRNKTMTITCYKYLEGTSHAWAVLINDVKHITFPTQSEATNWAVITRFNDMGEIYKPVYVHPILKDRMTLDDLKQLEVNEL